MIERSGRHTLGSWLSARALQSPDHIAIDDRGVQCSYGALWERARSLATLLERAGYGTGGRIATVSGNSTDHVVAFFACALLGIAFIPLSWRLTPGELSALIARSSPDLLFVEDEHQALATAALEALVDPPATAEIGALSGGLELPTPAERRAVRPPRDDDPLLVIYTSGSEAAPKGVVLTHANCFWTNEALAAVMPLDERDVVLATLPQHHVAAWNVQPLLALRSGATVVLERSFHPRRILQLIARRGVTTMMGVPTQFQMLSEDPEWDRTDLTSLRRAIVGGATIPVDTARIWAERGVALAQGYGLTEAGPNVMYLAAEDATMALGSVGRPYPSVEVCLRDPDTREEFFGAATGELWVRGPNVFHGYLDDPEATARAKTGEWLRTGDLLSRDLSGQFSVVDRIKDIYISGGENVAPAEVEQVLRQHAGVQEVAVVGVPDIKWGETGVAFVVADPTVTAASLLGFARERLAGFKVPTRVEFVDALPRATIDKVARGELRRRARVQAVSPATAPDTAVPATVAAEPNRGDT